MKISRASVCIGVAAALLVTLRIPTAGAADERAVAEAVAKAPARNVARGKPYRFSTAPTGMWYGELRQTGQPLPDVARVLTDGEVEDSLSCWRSNRCVSFNNIDSVEVVIDLGDVYPVAEISTRHGARPGAGVRLPRKEEYFVSEDGTHFVKVGEFENPKDPAKIPPGGDRTSMHAGRLTYSSGPIRTRGRYVAVRTSTWPVDPDAARSMRFLKYVGYDEITVKGGLFEPGEASFDASQGASLQEQFPPSTFGYRIAQPDWTRIIRDTPLYIAVSPQQFLGDDEYHLSVGGTYVVTFQCYDNATSPVTGVEFTVDFPVTVTVHDYNGRLPLAGTRTVERDGKKYTRYTQTLIDGQFEKGRDWPFYVVSTAVDEPGSDLGMIQYRYGYTVGQRKVESGTQQLRLVLDERIDVAPPRKLLAGFWLPYQARYFTRQDETLRRLFSFYRHAGFNGANGGQSSSLVHANLSRLGMQDFTGNGLSPNALMFARFDEEISRRMAREAPFVFHPRSRKKKHHGVCPTKFLDEKYDALRVEVARDILSRTTHIYDNWEPYMFLKQGCVCDACREAYRKFGGLSEGQIEEQWPDVVVDPKAGTYNDFLSRQYGQLVLALQEAVVAAGKERRLDHRPAYVLSINPGVFFDPRDVHFQMHNARDYFGGIDKLMIWKYDNTVSLLGVNASQSVGNNLTMTRDFDNTLDLVRRYGRKGEGGSLPEIYYLSTEGFGDVLVLPADNYFLTVLAFVHGMDGWGTWTLNFKPDARYVAAQARANAVASRYEEIVVGRTPLAGHRAELASPAQAERGATDVVYVRGFAHGDERVVALGVDDYRPTVVRLSVPDLASGSWLLVDRIHETVYTGDGAVRGKPGFSSSQLAEGVLIDMPGKTWRMLEVVKAGADPGIEGFERRAPADVRRMVERRGQGGGGASSS